MKTAKAIEEIRELGFRAFEYEGAVVAVSAEEGDDAADYYAMGDWSEGMLDAAGLDGFGINLKLAAWAEEHGLYWEWMHPGGIAAYPA